MPLLGAPHPRWLHLAVWHFFFFSSRRRHTRFKCDWSSDVCSSDLFVDITLDEQPFRVPAGTSIFDAARMNGITIPTLCHLQNQTPVGVCRVCVVDTGEIGRASCRERV